MNNLGLRKVAILMMLLKDERIIREIFNKLDSNEIYEISFAMTNLGNVESDEAVKVIMEFEHDLNQSLQLIGNLKTADKKLQNVLNEQEYATLMDQIKHAKTNSIWEMISNMDVASVAQFIKNEYPQTAAFILSKLPPYKSANVLKLLNEDYSIEVIRRIVHLDTVKSDTLAKVEKAIENEINSFSSQFHKKESIYIAAEIFNNFPKDDELRIMNALKECDATSAERISKLMLSFDDLLLVNNNGIQTLIKNLDSNTIAVALVDASEEVRQIFFSSMSQRVCRMIMEDIEMQKYSKKDVNDAQIRVLQLLKKLVFDGSVTINKRIHE